VFALLVWLHMAKNWIARVNGEAAYMAVSIGIWEHQARNPFRVKQARIGRIQEG